MSAYIENTSLLVVTENGFGKRTELDEYKVQFRGGKGILTYRVTERTGKLVGMKLVCDDDDVMLISSDCTIIRIKAQDISVLGRATQGVTLMRMNEGVKVMAVARIVNEDDDEVEDGKHWKKRMKRKRTRKSPLVGARRGCTTLAGESPAGNCQETLKLIILHL